MKKSLTSLLLAVTANVLIAVPAIAYGPNSGSQPFYAPSFDEEGVADGGCRDAYYYEDDGTVSYTYDIPALADGESITVAPTARRINWTAPWGAPEPWVAYNSEYTFTCNNGTLSSPGTSQFGNWG